MLSFLFNRCNLCDSLVHELDDLVFAAELWQCVLLLALLEILNRWETRDLKTFPHGFVHCGIHCCQHTWTLRRHKKVALQLHMLHVNGVYI